MWKAKEVTVSVCPLMYAHLFCSPLLFLKRKSEKGGDLALIHSSNQTIYTRKQKMCCKEKKRKKKNIWQIMLENYNVQCWTDFKKHISPTNIVKMLKAGCNKSFWTESVAERVVIFASIWCLIHILVRMPHQYVDISKRVSKKIVWNIRTTEWSMLERTSTWRSSSPKALLK